jgi:hypothetical protein
LSFGGYVGYAEVGKALQFKKNQRRPPEGGRYKDKAKRKRTPEGTR